MFDFIQYKDKRENWGRKAKETGNNNGIATTVNQKRDNTCQ